jgi:TRAP-type uncharacterized transport system fused permease subunit
VSEQGPVHGTATEERIIPDAAEFASAASKATVLCTNILQALLIAVVVLWVLDVPRRGFNVSFYTEQLLTVCLGLTLALAFIAGGTRKPSAIDWGGAVSSVFLAVYVVFRYVAADEVSPWAVGGLGLTLIWTVIGNRAWASRPIDWGAAAVSLLLCGYIAVRYEPLTYEIALLPREGIIGSAILTILVLEGSRRISGWGFVGIILAMAVYIYISPYLPGDFQTRYVTPERLVVYIGLDVNGIISAILQVAVLIVIPFTILGQVLARTGGADFFSDIAMSAMGRFQDRGGGLRLVRNDLRQRGLERARGRHRDDSDHDQVGLHALPGGSDRIGRIDRRAVDAACHGRRRLHHGGVPAGLIRRGLRGRRHSGDSLLRLPVHPRRPRGGQA